VEAGKVLVLGGGLTGLAAGCVLSRECHPVAVIESSPFVGGLARTIRWGENLFDLGGHRFHTSSEQTLRFVSDLMGAELLQVPRRSKICLNGQLFDYPLRPLNALAGMGMGTSLRILFDYARERVRTARGGGEIVSLRDKVVQDFGESLFRIFFRDYSEKVWGLSCDSISSDWIAKRVGGLSLGGALKHALGKKGGGNPSTFVDSFLYPSLGIGRLAERLAEETRRNGKVLTGTPVKAVLHDGSRVTGVTTGGPSGDALMRGGSFVSSIPLPKLARMLDPELPPDIIAAASRLRYRDLVVVALLVDRPRVTDQTWMYFPDREIPFGRIHEPKNWSSRMSPPDKTVLVVEYFCFAGDRTWETGDDELGERTSAALERLGFLRQGEVCAATTVRVPKAYPLFDVGYRRSVDQIASHLKRFDNLHCAGRTGSFGYLNMDEALESGMAAAEAVLSRSGRRGGDGFPLDAAREKVGV
jgi:protoporphyrinogen oxidase